MTGWLDLYTDPYSRGDKKGLHSLNAISEFSEVEIENRKKCQTPELLPNLAFLRIFT
jgi:hypothetical protein